MAIRRMRIACWIPKAKKHTLRICNTHCFSTATMVARTHLTVTLHIHCLPRMLLKQSIVFLHSVNQPTKALIKIQQNTNHKTQFMTSIKPLHVSALQCRLQGDFDSKGIQVQGAIPESEHFKHSTVSDQ